jgi:hypothetical protein
MVIWVKVTNPDTGDQQFLRLPSVPAAQDLCIALNEVANKLKWESTVRDTLVYVQEED